MNDVGCGLLTAVLGLCVGSFLNVVIHRLPDAVLNHAASPWQVLWQPGSHCPHCGQALRLWHLVPVLSWLVLRGRCAFCQQPIAWRYPLIELGTAALWLLCFLQWGFTTDAWAWSVFASLLLALAVIDAKTCLLPDVLTQPLLWLGLLASQQHWIALPLTDAVQGAMLGYLSLWLVATLFERLTGKEGMGAGDFKLLAALGAWLGPLALLPVVLLASASGAVVGIGLQQSGRLPEQGYVPFGPFLALAAGVMVFQGPAIERLLFAH